MHQYLIELLRSCVRTGSEKSPTTMKDRTCVYYAHMRQTKLPQLWKDFLFAINCVHVAQEPLLMEIVNESIFEGIIKELFVSAGESSLA